MNNDLSTTDRIDEVCPICRTHYQTPKKLPVPTCGNPNCIREARARGLPFTRPSPIAPEEPKKEKKPKKDKPRSADLQPS